MFVGGLNPHIISQSMFWGKGQVMSSPSQTARLRPIKTLVPTSQGNKKVSVGQVGQVDQVIGVTVSDRFGPTNCSSFFTNCPFCGIEV